jgi:hypothetical protein
VVATTTLRVPRLLLPIRPSPSSLLVASRSPQVCLAVLPIASATQWRAFARQHLRQFIPSIRFGNERHLARRVHTWHLATFHAEAEHVC